MSMESEVYARLSAFTGLTALVSTRIYPLILPQDATLPAVCFQVISQVRTSNFGVDTGDVKARIQITCYGDKASGQAAVLAVREQCRLALQRYASGNIKDIYVEGGGTGFEPEAKIFTAMMDFMMWFKES